MQALGVSFQNGHLLIAKSGLSSGFIMLVPNFKLLDKMKELYLEAIERNPDVSSFRLAYRMFMSRSTELLYSYGQKERAQELFDTMRKEKMPEVNGMNLDQFVYKRWEKNMLDSGFKQRMQMISAMITQSAYLLAHGDYEASESFMALGKMAYDRHMADLGVQERQALKPFEMLRKEIFDNIISIMNPALAEALKGEINDLNYRRSQQMEAPPDGGSTK